MLCTPTRCDTIPKYTGIRWKVIRAVEDAYKKRILDTIIDTLRSQIALLKATNVAQYASFTQELKAEREKGKLKSEIITYQTSLTEYYKSEARRFKRQRNFLLAIPVGLSAYGIYRVFKPP